MNRAQRRRKFKQTSRQDRENGLTFQSFNTMFKKDEPIVVFKDKHRVGYKRRQKNKHE